MFNYRLALQHLNNSRVLGCYIFINFVKNYPPKLSNIKCEI